MVNVVDESRPAGDAPRSSPLDEVLREWTAEGLIDDDQASAISEYEARRATPPEVPPPPPDRAAPRIPLIAEAVGYVGSALVLTALFLLLANRWDSLSTVSRIAALAVPTIGTAVAGYRTGPHDEPALQRLASVLWALTVLGVAGLAAELWVDAIHGGDPPEHYGVLVVGGASVCAAAAFWSVRRTALQVLVLFVASVVAVFGIVDAVAESVERSMGSLSIGLALMALGALWVAAAVARTLTPATLVGLCGATVTLLGAQVVRIDSDVVGIWVGLAAAVVLVATAVATTEPGLMIVGAAGLFQWIPQISLHYLEERLGTELTLLLIGAVLIVLAPTINRLYRLGAEEPPSA